MGSPHSPSDTQMSTSVTPISTSITPMHTSEDTQPEPSIKDNIALTIQQPKVPPPSIPDEPGRIPLPQIPRRARGPLKVGILGAGAAGLYAAMILEGFKEYGYTYEILEAEPESDHVGGRLWTHKFSDSPNDYYVSVVAVICSAPSSHYLWSPQCRTGVQCAFRSLIS